eukprot:scaffold18145_cov20-Prasinocladus_malaysianus.AAC.1
MPHKPNVFPKNASSIKSKAEVPTVELVGRPVGLVEDPRAAPPAARFVQQAFQLPGHHLAEGRGGRRGGVVRRGQALCRPNSSADSLRSLMASDGHLISDL